MDIKQEFREEKNMDVYAMNVNDGSFSNVYVKWLEAKINYTHSCTELKTFDIHECINEVTKSANKLSPWIVDARKDRSFRYIIKKAIDKMLYSN
tara:strand:+ start:62 stop:343 length:282 start_codon:yes stop_codon:yes gene_type:complete